MNDDGPRASFGSPAPGVDPRLLAILVCPLTRMPLRYDADEQELINDAAGLAYPIRDGVPIMLVEHAREMDPQP